ncbi:MAG: WG repeat-containing protein [Bacteroidales bacterium]|nr:WG repeat-containing protein [Bacteroidales bacterium]
MKKTLLLLALSLVAITTAKAQISGSWNLSRETMDGRPLHVFTASYSEDSLNAVRPLLEKELRDKQSSLSADGGSAYVPKKVKEDKPTPQPKPVYKPVSLDVAKELRNMEEKSPKSALLLQQNKGKWGFVNEKGKTKIKMKYDKVEPFTQGLSCVMSDGLYGYVNEEGNLVTGIMYEVASSYFRTVTDLVLACCRKDGKYGLLKNDGSVYLDFQYADLRIVNYAYALATDGTGKVNVVVLDARPLSTAYDEVSIVDGTDYAIAKRGGKAYFIDRKGKEEKDLCFDDAEDMGGGLVLVSKNGKYGVLDKNLQMIVPCNYTNASFDKGCYQIGNDWEGFGIVSQGKVVVPADSKKTVLVPFQESAVYQNDKGKFNLVRYDGTFIFENMNGVGNYDEEESLYYADYGKSKLVYNYENDRYGMAFGKEVNWLPEDAKDFTFDGVIGRYITNGIEPHYISKEGKALTELEGAVEVRTLNNKYLAVCFRRKSATLNNSTSPKGISMGGGQTEDWEVASADGKILTDKRFAYIGEFNSKGELPYEVYDKKSWQYVKGKMKFNGDKVTYLK